MKDWQKCALGLALIFLTGWPANRAQATSISGRASTVIEWFDNAEEETVVPAFQYLQLNALDLGNKGYDFRFYGRAGTDLAGEQTSYADSRLYYAYLDKRNFLTESLDLRLGRQFITTTAGASLLDGLRFDYKFLDKYRLTVFGGGDVTYYEGYNAQDAAFGGEIAGRFFDGLDLGFSYLSKWDEGLLSHELFGFNASYDWNHTLYLYNETQYDNLSERISYLRLGVKHHLSPAWTVSADYLYSLPVFSATSIYSVFAVDEYKEVDGEVTYAFGSGWRAFGRYTREIYQEFADADVFEAGLEKIRTNRFSGYLSGVYRNDPDGQDLRGFKAHAACLFNRKVQAGLGVELNVLQREIQYFETDPTADDTTSKRYWADMSLFLTPKITLQAKIERIESAFWDYYNQGLIRLNTSF